MSESLKIKSESSFIKRNRYIILSFAVTLGLWAVIYLICQIIFGSNTILRMDLYHQYCPLMAEMYDRIVSGNFSAYSWESGLGSAFWGNFFNYLSSPIDLVVLLFGHAHVPEAIAAAIALKGALSAGTFAVYLKKSQRRHSVSTIAFSVLFSFCGYMLAYYWDLMWLDAMALLPLVLLGIERIINNGKIALFTVSLALTMFTNYYMSYMVCIFSVIYFFYYYIISSPSRDKLPGAEKFSLRSSRFFRSGLRFAVAAVFAGGIMAVVLIPTYTILQASSATSSSFPTDLKSYFNFLDFFANHLASLETTIRSSGEDVLPNVYCGMLSVILAPMYFFTSSISKKEKAATLGLLAIFFISFNTNYLNFIWHGFHFPNDLPYRFSFMYSFILCVIAHKTFVRLNEFSSKQIGAFGAAVLALIFIVSKVQSKYVDDRTIYISLCFAVIFTLVLTIFKDKRYEKSVVTLILTVFIACEVIVADTQAIKNTVTKESYEGDYATFRLIKDKLDTIEGNDTYRMELSDLRTRMDGCWFGYNSVSEFSSMAYETTSNLENRLGEMSNDINSYTYNPQTPVFNMMHSIKYVVNNSTPDIFKSKYYEQSVSEGKYTAYRNKYYLPIAYAVDSDILNWDTQFDINQHYVNPFYIQGQYFDLATNEGDPFVKLDVDYIAYNQVNTLGEDINANSYTYNRINSADNASVTFYIKTVTEGNVYIYYNVDGAEEKNVTFSADGLTISRPCTQDQIVDLGHFESGTTISVQIPVEKDNGGIRLYPYTMNDEIFEKGYSKLANTAMNISEFEGSHIKGSVSVKEDCVLYTSIPFDKGWKVSIDGEEVTGDDYIALSDALLAVKLPAGNHEIEFEYHIVNLAPSAMISAFMLVLFILWLFISKLKSGKARAVSFDDVDLSFSEDEIIPGSKATDPAPIPALLRVNEPKPFGREIIEPNCSFVKREIIQPKPKFKTNDLGEIKEVFEEEDRDDY